MGQINYIMLINPYPVCVADKPVHVSFSELKLGLKVALVSSGYTPPSFSLTFFPSLLPCLSLLSIAVYASGLDNVKQTP